MSAPDPFALRLDAALKEAEAEHAPPFIGAAVLDDYVAAHGASEVRLRAVPTWPLGDGGYLLMVAIPRRNRAYTLSGPNGRTQRFTALDAVLAFAQALGVRTIEVRIGAPLGQPD